MGSMTILPARRPAALTASAAPSMERQHHHPASRTASEIDLTMRCPADVAVPTLAPAGFARAVSHPMGPSSSTPHRACFPMRPVQLLRCPSFAFSLCRSCRIALAVTQSLLPLSISHAPGREVRRRRIRRKLRIPRAYELLDVERRRPHESRPTFKASGWTTTPERRRGTSLAQRQHGGHGRPHWR